MVTATLSLADLTFLTELLERRVLLRPDHTAQDHRYAVGFQIPACMIAPSGPGKSFDFNEGAKSAVNHAFPVK